MNVAICDISDLCLELDIRSELYWSEELNVVNVSYYGKASFQEL